MRYITFAFTLLFTVSTSVMAQSKVYGPEKAERKVLIAWEETKFKKLLVQNLVKILDDGKTYIKVVDHKSGGLKGENASSYTAVFISNSGVKTMVRPWVTQWIAAQSSRKNIILHTTQKAFWEVKTDVDTVTSASAPHAVELLAKKYAAKILAVGK